MFFCRNPSTNPHIYVTKVTPQCLPKCCLQSGLIWQHACYPADLLHSDDNSTLGPGSSTRDKSLPCSSASEHQRNGISSQNTSQARKVRVTVWWLLEHTFVHLYLQKRGRRWFFSKQGGVYAAAKPTLWIAVLQMGSSSSSDHSHFSYSYSSWENLIIAQYFLWSYFSFLTRIWSYWKHPTSAPALPFTHFSQARGCSQWEGLHCVCTPASKIWDSIHCLQRTKKPALLP